MNTHNAICKYVSAQFFEYKNTSLTNSEVETFDLRDEIKRVVLRCYRTFRIEYIFGKQPSLRVDEIHVPIFRSGDPVRPRGLPRILCTS